jgi:hypothetical protein
MHPGGRERAGSSGEGPGVYLVQGNLGVFVKRKL